MVSLNDLIGYTTAIGAATRESGSIIGNSLKTIFARITTNSKAISALESVGISIEDYNGQARSSSDILAELAGRWDTLSDAQRQQVGVGVAGIYQLSR